MHIKRIINPILFLNFMVKLNDFLRGLGHGILVEGLEVNVHHNIPKDEPGYEVRFIAVDEKSRRYHEWDMITYSLVLPRINYTYAKVDTPYSRRNARTDGITNVEVLTLPPKLKYIILEQLGLYQEYLRNELNFAQNYSTSFLAAPESDLRLFQESTLRVLDKVKSE